VRRQPAVMGFAGPDAKVGTRRQSPDGYYNVLECSWSVTISARGGRDGDVAQIIGASPDAVGPGYRSTNIFNADETTHMLGTDHITRG
jgi:hypothetical protein